MRKLRAWVVMLVVTGMSPLAGRAATQSRFEFGGSGRVTAAEASVPYSDETGYGMEPGQVEGAVKVKGVEVLRSGTPFAFSVREPEGNYRVTLTLGDPERATETTVKAETRRLMLEGVKTTAGETIKRSFLVHVKQPAIRGTTQAVKAGHASRSWDDKLTVEFVGPVTSLQEIAVEPAPADAVTVYVAGDSTVCDQATEPYYAWGQMLPRFFNSTVAVANYAESGRRLYTFRDEHRLEKILSQIKKGDYLFVQFGHNDQKDTRPGSGAFTSFTKDLEEYVQVARDHGATPVLVTPMYRRRFDAAGKLQESLGDFPEAVRRVAADKKVALIDLHEMSGRVFQALGNEGTLKAFVHFPAGSFPGQKGVLDDNTHFTAYGAYEMARCVAEGIRRSDLALAKELAGDVAAFDPDKPDPVNAFKFITSPPELMTAPSGS